MALQAAPLLAEWVRANVKHPVIIGPDEESEQWVSGVAAAAGCGYLVLKKQRRGDRDVTVSGLSEHDWADRTPVLVDDIISSGQTMAQAVTQCRSAGSAPAVCVGVHGIFAPDALTALQQAGAARIVTTNSIAHPSNAIDLSPLLAGAVRRFWQGVGHAPILDSVKSVFLNARWKWLRLMLVVLLPLHAGFAQAPW